MNRVPPIVGLALLVAALRTAPAGACVFVPPEPPYEGILVLVEAVP